MSQVQYFESTSMDIRVPIRASPLSAGLDITCPYDLLILPGEKNFVVNTRITLGEAFRISNLYCEVRDRSSLYLKGLRTLHGIIDTDFKGEIKVVVSNVADRPVCVKKGEALAQLLIHKNMGGIAGEANTIWSERGKGEFGSTVILCTCKCKFSFNPI